MAGGFAGMANDYLERNGIYTRQELVGKPKKKIRRGISPESRTYGDWRRAGYIVVKGQKATSWTKDGKAKFDFEQVKPLQRDTVSGDSGLGDEDDGITYEEFVSHPDYYEAFESIGWKD